MSLRKWQKAVDEHLEQHRGRKKPIPFDLVLLLLIERNTRRSVALLRRIARALEPGPTASINAVTTITTKEGIPVPVLTPVSVDPTLNDLGFKTVPKDAAGTPTNAVVNFTSDNLSVVTIEPVDGQNAKGRVVGPGTCNVTMSVGDVFDIQPVNAGSGGGAGPTATINATTELIPKGALSRNR